MLEIIIPANDSYDERTETFISTKETKLRLEHSLVSLSKWESKWCKPFFSRLEKTTEETIDYVKCMTLTQNVDQNVYLHLTSENVSQINKYIEHPMTATYFPKENKGKSNSEQVTAELIYYWMIALQIPPEYQKWHLNRLLTLIRVCNLKNQPPKKRSRREIMARNAELNRQRRERMNSTG